MAINATNYDGTKDYKIAELDDLYRQNILTNGDFKINQRGKSSYSLTGGTTAYTVDMWAVKNPHTVKVTPQSDGILIDNTSGTTECYFTQSFKGSLPNASYIFSFEISQITGTVTIYSEAGSAAAQTLSGTGRKTFRTTGSLESVGFNLKTGAKIKLKYIDLFTGSVAYPHIEEADDVAILRCQRYYWRISDGVIGWGSRLSNGLISVVVNFPIVMETAPTITCNNTNIKAQTYENTYPHLSLNGPLQVTKTGAIINFNQTSAATSSTHVMPVYIDGTTGYIEFSCESF